jgi:hypothetical protein
MKKWLDKYNDGGPVQPNYNDYSVSASNDFVGEGYTNRGRNYSPAWGGQFQSGGYLSPKEYNKKHPPIYLSNPKDSRIGYYAPAGNQYLYKKPVQTVAKKSQPTPQSVIDWIEGRGKDENAPTRLTTSEDFAMGGSMPGAVGFTYARTIGPPAPSKGPYGKKTPASAQNGMEMKYYQNGLDWKPKSISKNGSKIIKDDRGQWAHPGKVTQIGSNQITMQGVPYPVLGISDTGDMQMMYPNQDYNYHGSSVTEYPMMAQGGQLTKLDQLTNFTNYNTKQPGGWLDKYQ